MKTDIKFYITESLFKLLKTKNLKEINITDIVNLSNISRTSFYNNFSNINDILDYKFNLMAEDLYNIYSLNKLRKKDNKELLNNILKYIDNNKDNFLIIKNKFYFEFKNTLDNYFINKINDKYDYYIKSGIIINLCLYYIENNFNIDAYKIKID